MNRNKSILVLLFIMSFVDAKAQEAYQFTEGLVIEDSHRYGREALYTDQLAYQLYTGILKQPTEGEAFATGDSGSAVVWKAIAADTANKFRGRPLANGYLYLTYDSDREQTALLNVAGHSMLYFNGQPRTGDIYSDGWLYLPVQLKKGTSYI